MHTVTMSRRALSALVGTNLLLLAAMSAMLLSGFTSPTAGGKSPAVISAERLEIVDSAGRPVLILANGPRLPGARFHGKEYPQSFVDRGRAAGMIFYNSNGDEVGGLIYDGAPRDSGRYSALGHLSFDQWQQTQVLALTYSDDGRSRFAGLRVWDRPNEPLEQQFAAAEKMVSATGAARDSLRQIVNAARARVAGTQRIFVGSQDKNASVELRDPRGRVRARLGVDSLGNPRLTFLDSTGAVKAQYPPGV